MSPPAAPAPPTATHVIAIGGGKGGVGKSLIACNLAVALAQLGRTVVIADLDLGAANLHLLYGIAKPRPGLRALLEGTTDDVREALTPTGVPGLSFIAGTGAVLGAANITYQEKRKLLRKLRALDATVIVDIGAGVGFNPLDFFLLGSQRVVVTTPQVTAIHDAYSFLKGAVLRLVRQQADQEVDVALLEPALLSGEGARVSNILARLQDQKPELARRVYAQLARFGGYMIGNQVSDPKHGGVFTSVARMMRDYLGIDVGVLGWLPDSARMRSSVNERRPLMLGPPSEETSFFRSAAEALLAEDAAFDEDQDLVIEDDGAPPAAAASG